MPKSCPNCGEQVSTMIETCPHCGKSTEGVINEAANYFSSQGWAIVFGFIVLGGLLFFCVIALVLSLIFA